MSEPTITKEDLIRLRNHLTRGKSETYRIEIIARMRGRKSKGSKTAYLGIISGMTLRQAEEKLKEMKLIFKEASAVKTDDKESASSDVAIKKTGLSPSANEAPCICGKKDCPCAGCEDCHWSKSKEVSK